MFCKICGKVIIVLQTDSSFIVTKILQKSLGIRMPHGSGKHSDPNGQPEVWVQDLAG